MDDFKTILQNKRLVKPPAYQWQEQALEIIAEFKIPANKRSAVFKVCKQYPARFIKQCLNDTKELASGKSAWRYFFKLIAKAN